jgi:hypothetical protein
MKPLLVTVIGLVLGAATVSATIAPFAPGTPCIDIVGNNVPCTANPTPTSSSSQDPLFVLANDPGTVPLLLPTGGPIFVVPGDVVLFESNVGVPSSTNTSFWSDVVRFSDGPNGSIATTFADAENFGVILPPGFTLSLNAVGIQETLTGNGTDANDFTTYVAGSATYQIHSDCAGPGCELPEPNEGTPEPSMMGLLGFGFAGIILASRLRSRKA